MDVADALVALPLEAQCVCMPRAKISWRRKCVSKYKCGRRVAEGYSEAGVGLSRKAAGHQGSQLGEICDPQTPHGSHRGITGSRQSRKAGSAPSCEQGRIRCTSGGNVSAPGRHPAAEIGKQLATLNGGQTAADVCVRQAGKAGAGSSNVRGTEQQDRRKTTGARHIIRYKT